MLLARTYVLLADVLASELAAAWWQVAWDYMLANWSFLSIPLVSAIVGWGTNVLALKMTFYPLEFIGIPPYMGWQGIIPSKAARMAGMSVDMMTQNLIKVEEQFALLEPEKVAQEMGEDLDRIARDIIDKVMNAQVPAIWSRTPLNLRQKVYDRIAVELPSVVERMMEDFKNNITDIFDLRSMVIETLIKDKQLLNDIFIKCGEKEFIFIERSGFYFGFIFGLPQMAAWYVYPEWWSLPLAGLIVGYATNWLALKLIFSPLNPVRIGPWVLQGLFMKRQKEVAKEYAAIVASQILNSQKVYETILYGADAQKLKQIVERHLQDVVDRAGQEYKPLVDILSKKRVDVVKNIVSFHFNYDFPLLMRKVYSYTEEALNIEATLRDKMQALSTTEFQGFLRPVFQEDELKLILVGAVLGFLAGLAQLYFFF